MDQNPRILDFLRQRYTIPYDSEIRALAGGEENSNFLVVSGADRYVLRVYSAHHSTTGLRRLPEIEFELDFMEAAQEHGLPTPPVIRTQSGDRVSAITWEGATRFATFLGYAQGSETGEYTPERARAVAQTLLSLRRASLAFRRPVPRPWPGDIVQQSLDFYAACRRQITRHTALLDHLYLTSRSGYAQIRAASLPVGVIHGDVKLGNLLFLGDRISAVIDFDDYRQTFLLEEFTRTVMHDLDSPTRNAIRAGCYPVFHAALAADSAVTQAELAHLGTFLRARLVYDLASYALAGLNDLVDEVLADQNVRSVILSGL